MIDTSVESPKSGRRRFLRWVTGVGAFLSAAFIGLPSLRAFLSPALRKPAEPDWIRLGDAGLFDLGTATKVAFAQTVADAWVENRVLRSVWVYTEDGNRFTVYSGRCPHLGCGFGFDKVAQRFHCPCHEGVFDLKTGAVLAGPPPRALDRLETKIEDGNLYCAYRDFRVGIPVRIAV